MQIIDTGHMMNGRWAYGDIHVARWDAIFRVVTGSKPPSTQVRTEKNKERYPFDFAVYCTSLGGDRRSLRIYSDYYRFEAQAIYDALRYVRYFFEEDLSNVLQAADYLFEGDVDALWEAHHENSAEKCDD